MGGEIERSRMGIITGNALVFNWEPWVGLLWLARVEAFASEGWHGIAPDMIGYGRSSSLTTLKPLP